MKNCADELGEKLFYAVRTAKTVCQALLSAISTLAFVEGSAWEAKTVRALLRPSLDLEVSTIRKRRQSTPVENYSSDLLHLDSKL